MFTTCIDGGAWAMAASALALCRPQHCSASAFPDPARVVLAARDHGVAIVIKRARKNFVDVPFENLEAFAGLHAPHAASLVA